jgi:hypothetical protein
MENEGYNQKARPGPWPRPRSLRLPPDRLKHDFEICRYGFMGLLKAQIHDFEDLPEPRLHDFEDLIEARIDALEAGDHIVPSRTDVRTHSHQLSAHCRLTRLQPKLLGPDLPQITLHAPDLFTQKRQIRFGHTACSLMRSNDTNPTRGTQGTLPIERSAHHRLDPEKHGRTSDPGYSAGFSPWIA